jgi:hypothetical protein
LAAAARSTGESECLAGPWLVDPGEAECCALTWPAWPGEAQCCAVAWSVELGGCCMLLTGD